MSSSNHTTPDHDISFNWFKRPLPPPLIPTQTELDLITAKARAQDSTFAHNYCPDLSTSMFNISQWEDFIADRVSVPILNYDSTPRSRRYPLPADLGDQFGVIDESKLTFTEKRRLQLIDVMCHGYQQQVDEEKERMHRKKMDELRKKHGVN